MQSPGIARDIGSYCKAAFLAAISGLWWLLVEVVLAIVTGAAQAGWKATAWHVVAWAGYAAAFHLFVVAPFLLWRKQRTAIGRGVDEQAKQQGNNARLHALSRLIRALPRKPRHMHSDDSVLSEAGSYAQEAIELGAFDDDKYIEMCHAFRNCMGGEGLAQLNANKSDLRKVSRAGLALIESMKVFIPTLQRPVSASPVPTNSELNEMICTVVADRIDEHLMSRGFKPRSS